MTVVDTCGWAARAPAFLGCGSDSSAAAASRFISYYNCVNLLRMTDTRWITAAMRLLVRTERCAWTCCIDLASTRAARRVTICGSYYHPATFCNVLALRTWLSGWWNTSSHSYRSCLLTNVVYDALATFAHSCLASPTVYLTTFATTSDVKRSLNTDVLSIRRPYGYTHILIHFCYLDTVYSSHRA